MFDVVFSCNVCLGVVFWVGKVYVVLCFVFFKNCFGYSICFLVINFFFRIFISFLVSLGDVFLFMFFMLDKCVWDMVICVVSVFCVRFLLVFVVFRGVMLWI